MRIYAAARWTIGVVLGFQCMLPAADAVGRNQSLDLSQRAYQRASWVLEHACRVHCARKSSIPNDQIEERLNGEVWANTDNAGFASWVIYQVSPDRLFAVQALKPGSECPQASTFAHFFAALPTDKPMSGWIGVNNVADLRAGDFIAWDGEHASSRHARGGHVAIVADSAKVVPNASLTGNGTALVSVLVIDSSTCPHFPPEQLPPLADQKRRDGVAKGCIRLLVNQDGKAVGYFEGSNDATASNEPAKPTVSPIISFGRLVGAAHFPRTKASSLDYQQRYSYTDGFSIK